MFSLWIGDENTRETNRVRSHHILQVTDQAQPRPRVSLGAHRRVSTMTSDIALGIREHKGESTAHLGHVHGVHPGQRGDCCPHSRRNIAGNGRGVDALCRQCGIFDRGQRLYDALFDRRVSDWLGRRFRGRSRSKSSRSGLGFQRNLVNVVDVSVGVGFGLLVARGNPLAVDDVLEEDLRSATEFQRRRERTFP